MPRKREAISILGMDTRPLARQATPGLCKEIKNLRPDGIENDPYWVPVPKPNQIGDYKRSDILQVAPYKNYSVALIADDKIQLLKPAAAYAGVDADMILEELEINSDPDDLFEIDVLENGNIGILKISKNNDPFRLLFIDEDQEAGGRFIDFTCPDLPVVKVFSRDTEESYTLDDYSNGVQKGLIQGRYYWRYAFRIGSGNHVLHSKPLPITLNSRYDEASGSGTNAKYFLNELVLFFEGFEQVEKPANYEFWKKLILGVSVFLTPRIGPDIDAETSSYENIGDFEGAPGFDPQKELNNAQFFEIGYFPFIDYDEDSADATINDRVVVFQEDAADIPINEQLEIDNYTHHRQVGEALFGYNARLFLGDTATDFAVPSPNIFNSIYFPRILVSRDGDTITVDFLTNSEQIIHASDLTVSGTDITNIDVGSVITATVSGSSWDMSITYADNITSGEAISILPPFEVTLTPEHFSTELSTYYDDLDGYLIDYEYLSIPAATKEIDIRYEVNLKIGSSEFHRVTPFPGIKGYIDRLDSTDPSIEFRPFGGYLFYADNRTSEMAVYAVDESYDGVSGTINAGSGKIEVSKSNTINGVISSHGFLLYHSLLSSGGGYSEQPSQQRDFTSTYRQTNRLIVSETNYPYSFQPENTYYFGRDHNKVQAFGVNTLPISEGQFGQFPLYVFTEGETWALQQGGDPLVAFSSQAPVSLSHGLSDSRKVVNVGRSLAFIYNKNIYTISGGNIEQIGDPIRDLLTGEETLACYNNDDNVELWVVSENYILAYNLEFGRWFMVDRQLKAISSQGNILQSIDNQGFFLDEYDLSDDSVSVSIQTMPIHYGYPDYLKRIHHVVLRASLQNLSGFSITFEKSGKNIESTSKYIRPRHRSDFSYTAEITGQMRPGSNHYIHRLDSEFDLRYQPNRQSQTTPES